MPSLKQKIYKTGNALKYMKKRKKRQDSFFKSNLFIVFAAVIVVLIILFLLYMFSDKSNNNGNEDIINNLEEEQTTESIEKTLEPKTYEVEIKNFKFVPNKITIKSGDSVLWTNNDHGDNTITSEVKSSVEKKELDSGVISKGYRYLHIFNNKGMYKYYSINNPYMKGVIYVE